MGTSNINNMLALRALVLSQFKAVLSNVKRRVFTESKITGLHLVKCCTNKTSPQVRLYNWASALHLGIVSKYPCTERTCPFKYCIVHIWPAAVSMETLSKCSELLSWFKDSAYNFLLMAHLPSQWGGVRQESRIKDLHTSQLVVMFMQNAASNLSGEF